MKILTESLNFSTKGMTDIINITEELEHLLDDSKLKEGNMTVFCPGSTAAITTIEYEPGLIRDLPEFLDEIIPQDRSYHHDETWGDNNGYAHLRSALFKTSLTVPFIHSKLILGTWQQVIFIDFDNRSRERNLVVQLIGE